MSLAISTNGTRIEHTDDARGLPWLLELTSPVGPQIYRNLRRWIVRSDLTPETAISEADIARRFATSRQPVREAFIKLADEGLLEVRPQRGTFVRRISKAEVLDARFVREAIESSIVRELATNPDAGLIRRLRRLLDEQAAVTPDSHDDFVELDDEFHRTLAESAGRLYAWKVIEDVKLQMDRVRHLSLEAVVHERIVSQHTAIVDSIERGAPDEAEREMRVHLRAILEDMTQIEARYPEYFARSDKAPKA
jgi:GntR family transcriptional regulator, rspAB operon transcriptional repressor